MVNRFCAICGKNINDGDSPHFGMCLECYLKENPLFTIPKNFSFNICLECLSFAKNEQWNKSENENIYDIIEEAIDRFMLEPSFKNQKIEFRIILDETTFKYTSKDRLTDLEIKVEGNLKENLKIKHRQKVSVHINYNLCKNCEKLRSGGYVSILQLRVLNETHFNLIGECIMEIQEYVERLYNNDKRQFISKIDEKKYGVDFFLSTNELLNYIISFLKGKYHFLLKRTKKLIGRDRQGGKNIYRLKALVKLLPFSIDEQLFIDDKLYNVNKILKNRVILQKKGGEKITRRFQYFFNKQFKILKESDS